MSAAAQRPRLLVAPSTRPRLTVTPTAAASRPRLLKKPVLGLTPPELRKALGNAQTLEMVARELRIRRGRPHPQPGPQTQFLQSTADIVIYGGSAGSAKSFGLLIWPLQYINNSKMRCVIFRRLTPELTNPGALWDESKEVYRYLSPNSVAGGMLEHRFDSGAYIKFGHLQDDAAVHSWDSSQIPLIGFDQLEQFTRHQFFYMHSRNRSMSGIPAQIRGACNPDADSWLAEFIAWWIDQNTGYPIKERSNVIRWFIRLDDTIIWADTREELMERYGRADLPKDHSDQPHPTSCTFIPGTIWDNPILLEKNPTYLARLKGLGRVERERLLGGNWKIRAAAGLMFQRAWCDTVNALPNDVRMIRGWDLAATKKTEINDPDWTVGVKLGYAPSTKFYYLVNAVRTRESPGAVKTLVRSMATTDGRECQIFLKQDPGQAGKSQFADMVSWLDGYTVQGNVVTGDKVTNFNPFSSQAEHHNVKILRGFNQECLQSLEGFPDAKHDDDADAVSAAYEGFQTMRFPMKISQTALENV